MPSAPLTMQFAQGLDLRADTTQATAPALVRAENIYFDRESSMRKRNGWNVLPNKTTAGTAITRATNLVNFNNELLLFDDTYMYSWADNLKAWTVRDVAVPTQVKQTGLPFNSTFAPQLVRSSTSDFWKTSNGMVVIDTITQAVLSVNPNSLGALVRTVNGAMLVGSSLTPISANGTQSGPMPGAGAVASFDGAAVVTVYQDTGNPARPIMVAAFNDGGSPAPGYALNAIATGGGTPTNLAVATNPAKPGKAFVAVDGDVFFYGDLSQIVPRALGASDYSLANPLGPKIGFMAADASGADFSAVTGTGAIAMNSVGVPSMARSLPLGCIAITGPFRRNNQTYSWVAYNPTVGLPQYPLPATGQVMSATKQTVAMLYNWTLQKYVAKMGYGALAYGTAYPPVVLTGDTYGHGILRNVALQSVAGVASFTGSLPATLTTVVSPYLASVRFPQANEQQSARIGATLFCANGLPFSYDGAQIAEHGFTVTPEIVAITETASTFTFPAGTRLYVAVYEWTDAQGQLHRSAPSPPFSYTRAAAAATAPVLTFNPLYLTNKSNVIIAFYKTTASGTLYFRCGTTTAIGAVIGVTPNAWIDGNDSDTTLQGGALLYTAGGELGSDAPPPCNLVSVAQQRLFVAGGEDENVITYSKQAVVGLGVGFSLALTQRIDGIPGPITAAEHIDDKHFVFKQNSISWWTGQGPTPNGSNSDYGPLQMLSNGIGCASIQSLVRTPNALLFQSVRGIYALGRDLSLTNIGAPIGPLNSIAFTNATLVPAQAHVRFGSAGADALVYSYEALSQYAAHNNVVAGQWTTFRNYLQTGACMWKSNTYAFCQLNGTVCVESPGYVDNGTAIPMVVQTGWLRPAGPLECGEFYELAILGLWRGPHTLVVDQIGDYSSATLGTLTYPAGAAVAGTLWGTSAFGTLSPFGGDGDTAYSLRGVMPLSSPAVGAVQLRLSDYPVSGQTLGDSVTLNALTIMASTDGTLLRGPQKKFAG